MAVDYVYRLEQPHVAGTLASVCGRIAESDACRPASSPRLQHGATNVRRTPT
ncbi:hypothetical protein BH24ACT23_BH24ACT23_12160 [soil metagenome]